MMPVQPSAPPEVFVSYSHAKNDEPYKDELFKRLKILADQQLISYWDDRSVKSGQVWHDEIIKRLESSRIILLLISSDFLSSAYITAVELKRASQRHGAQLAEVIPVLARCIRWETTAFGEIMLGQLQALPTGAKFIEKWESFDEAFTSVEDGIRQVVKSLIPISDPPAPAPSSVPTSYPTDYVRRHDEKGRDILELLRKALAPGKKGLTVLWGDGGTGKTRIAAEAASALAEQFGQSVVWASAEKRAEFSFATLLDEIAGQLGKPDLLKLAQGPKEQAVRELLRQTHALIVLDNFETVASAEERDSCVDFLATRAGCPALITSREKVAAPARNIPIKGMSNAEAEEFLDYLIEQTRVDFSTTRHRIIQMAESNPYIMLWVVAQIDEARTPKDVLDELERGEGVVAERVFDRSFTLPQVGEDGRAALLALSLFVPDAARGSLADVAGFSDDPPKLDKAAKSLSRLWLIKSTEENERLAVEGLTRGLARARLAADARSTEFRRRFVGHFLRYTQAHAQPTPEDFDALEAEKNNVLAAVDLAFEIEDWSGVIKIVDVLAMPADGVLSVRGYWDEAIKRNEQAAEAARKMSCEYDTAVYSHSAGSIRQSRGEYDAARAAYEKALEVYRKLKREAKEALALDNLGWLAQVQGRLEEARRLHNQSLAIKERLNDESGIAHTLHLLARLARDQGQTKEALRLCKRGLAIYEKHRNQIGIADTLQLSGWLARDRGDPAEARRLFDKSLAINSRLGDQGSLALTLHALGALAASQGELKQARLLYNESLEITQRLGDKSNVAINRYNLGLLEEKENNDADAARLFREALSALEELESPYTGRVRRDLKRVEARLRRRSSRAKPRP